MGAKKKPFETLSLAEIGVDAAAAGEAGSKTEVLVLGAAVARGRTQDRGRRHRGAADRGLPPEKRLV